ncbi:MAG: hypothetical protein INR62_01520 [Rhodospirillales bacterium]|nr:hypothetical protein [Acetobacter sp.]
MIREGLVQLLSATPGLDVCGHVADAAKALDSQALVQFAIQWMQHGGR